MHCQSRVLRELVTECIERHISPHQVNALRIAEESEREVIEAFANNVAQYQHEGDDD